MKPIKRIAAVLTALALAVFGLTACSETDDCDAAGTSPVTVAVAAQFADGKGPGGKSGKSKKSKVKVNGFDDCEADD